MKLWIISFKFHHLIVFYMIEDKMKMIPILWIAPLEKFLCINDPFALFDRMKIWKDEPFSKKFKPSFIPSRKWGALASSTCFKIFSLYFFFRFRFWKALMKGVSDGYSSLFLDFIEKRNRCKRARALFDSSSLS